MLTNNMLHIMGSFYNFNKRPKGIVQIFCLIKNSLISFSFLLIILSAPGCKIEPAAEINISTSNIIVPNSSGTDRISFTCNGKWTATASKAWFTITPTFGKGDGEVVIAYDENISIDERSGELILSSGTLSKSVTIVQSRTNLDIDKYSLSFPKDSSTARFNIISNTNWQIIIPTDINWISATPTSGTLNMHIDITVDPNPGFLREAEIIIRFAQTERKIKIIQQRGVNGPPEQPFLKIPSNNSSDENRLPIFRWSEAIDHDGHDVTYNLEYSQTNGDWIASETIQDTMYLLTSYLDENTSYRWRIKATDSTGEYSYSEVYNFRTGTKKRYFDGEHRISQTNSEGTYPSEILFIGDGYIPEDYVEGGKFDMDIDEGIESFFTVEPYKTYRNYFKVYKQAGYSRDEGVTQTDKNIIKNTKFGVAFQGSTTMSSDYNTVFSYAKLIPGIDNVKLQDLLIVIIVNENRYAGTCWTWSDGKSIAIVPVSRHSNPHSSYQSILVHEAGGHGFGRLADEYVSAANVGQAISSERLKQLQESFARNYSANVDLTGDSTKVKWSKFILKSGYNRVGTFQGAYYFSFGVWRSEISSCMISNVLYFNAPSREAIVKRIVTKAGIDYTLENFVKKDIVKEPPYDVAFMMKSFNPLTFVPLAPPVMMK